MKNSIAGNADNPFPAGATKDSATTPAEMHLIINCGDPNRNILEKLYADNQLSVPKASLERMGFNFAFFTHQVNPDNKSTVTMIYDYGFYPETKNFAEEQIAILRGDEVGP
jgi:hypothetical protein